MRLVLVCLPLTLMLGCDPPAPQPARAPEPMLEPVRAPITPDAFGALLESLGSGRAGQASRAVSELAAWHPSRVRHVWPRLAPVLEQALEARRIHYSETLFDLLDRAGPVGQDLATGGLRATQPEARHRAARWLVARGDAGLRVVIAALPGMPDADPEPGRIVIEVLARRQNDPSPHERAQLAGLLKLLADASPGDPDGDGLLQVLPQGLSEALARLSSLSADPDPAVRIASIEALGELGPRAVGALPKVTDRLHDPVPGVVEVAGEAVHRFGPKALGPLRRTLEDPEPRLRVLAARALGRVGQAWPGEAEALAARCLAGGLQDADKSVRLEVYRALAGMPAASFTDRLLAVGLGDPDSGLRLDVAHLLGQRQDNPRVVSALAQALVDRLSPSQEPEALGILAALQRHGRDAQAVFAPLSRAVRQGPEAVRAEALLVILAAGGHARRVMDLLAESLADRSPRVRVVAVVGLGKRLPMELKMRPRVKRLRILAQRIQQMAVNDPDLDVRRACRSVDVRLPG